MYVGTPSGCYIYIKINGGRKGSSPSAAFLSSHVGPRPWGRPRLWGRMARLFFLCVILWHAQASQQGHAATLNTSHPADSLRTSAAANSTRTAAAAALRLDSACRGAWNASGARIRPRLRSARTAYAQRIRIATTHPIIQSAAGFAFNSTGAAVEAARRFASERAPRASASARRWCESALTASRRTTRTLATAAAARARLEAAELSGCAVRFSRRRWEEVFHRTKKARRIKRARRNSSGES